MKVLGKSIKDLTPENIESLKSNQVRESKDLEYKLELPADNYQSKKGFLEDVSAMANTIGGTIVYGIKEKKVEKGQNTGIPESIKGLANVNLDHQKRRLESLLRDSLEPAITQVTMNELKVGAAQIMLLGVPRSLFAPHMVKLKDSWRFYRRNNGGNYPVDVPELRQLFLQAHEWEKQASIFRIERIERVRSGEVIPELDVGKPLFIHLMPLGHERENVDVCAKKDLLLTHSPLPRTNDRPNFDGYIVLDHFRDVCEQYIQYFRNGTVEIYTSRIHNPRNENPEVNDLPMILLEEACVKYISTELQLLQELCVQPPIAVFISVCNIKGGRIVYRTEHLTGRQNKFDRDDLLLPPVIIEDLDVEVPAVLQNTFDIIWQSAGWPRSLQYDDEGRWNPE